MLTLSCKIDPNGQITLPKDILKLFGWIPNMDVILEMKKKNIVIRPQNSMPPITYEIANMDLPVADWEQMEQEIEEGRTT